MLPLLSSVLLFIILAAGITWMAYRRQLRPARLVQQLGAPIGSETAVLAAAGEDGPRPLALVQQLGSYVPASPQDLNAARHELMAAGYRSDTAVPVFYGFKVICGVLLFFVMLFCRHHFTANPVLRMVLLLAGPFAGYSLPSFWLGRKVSQRQEKLRLALPDGLDLMVVSVEAGLGLDQAMQNVSRELRLAHPELSDELGLVILEMRAGKRRSEALKHLAERTGEPDTRRLVAVLIQSDKFGTSMADALRTHSDFMRTRRRQEAEERAGKVGVKLVFPIFFFILPSMIVVSAGPGLLHIFKYLFPMMKKF